MTTKQQKKKKIMIRNLIEISKWDELPGSREDLLKLADLPSDFELRSLPQFPLATEIRDIIGYPVARHSSGITDEWKPLHKKIKHLPRLVQQCILKAWGTVACLPPDQTKGWPLWKQKHYYGWSEEVYYAEVECVKSAHKRIAIILNSKDTE